MSGICGICETGKEFPGDILLAMVRALRPAHASSQNRIHERSIALACEGTGDLKGVARVGSIYVAADADLIDLSAAADALCVSFPEASALPPAELIARLYLRSGQSAIQLLHGAFSIAIWDGTAQRLLLAIDRLGIKGLYWRLEGDRLLFSSRCGAVRAAQSAPPEADPSAILQFLLFSAIPAPLSSDRGTRKLRPGTLLTFAAGNVKEEPYWDLEFPEDDNRPSSYWAQELCQGIRAAVGRHLGGLQPDRTGCFLSGGTDSSSVVAFATEFHGQTHSFSIVFDDRNFSEQEFVDTAVTAFHTRHHQRSLVPKDASEAVGNIVAHFDEPFANSSAIGSYYCALHAREQGIATLLAGDGGDELFGGNERYAADKRFGCYQSFPRWMRKGLIEPAVRLLPAGDSMWSLPRRYVRRANIPNPQRILSYGFFLGSPPEQVFEEGFLREVGTDGWLSIPEEHFSRAKTSSELNRLLYLDVKMTLADNDLRKVCGTADLAGVKVRFPLLDDRLAELSGRIPARLKLKGFEKRYIFKQAMKGILPEKILYKKKHGFGVPLAQWLLMDSGMQELMNDLLHDPATRQRGYFRAGFVERLMILHKKQPNYYGEIVWYLLALELWHRRHMDRSREVVHAL